MARTPSLTVKIRVTNPEWGKRAAAVAMMISRYSQPERIEIVRYPHAGSAEHRISSGYEALRGVQTEWLLSIDADSYVYGDVRELVRRAEARNAVCAIRHSPLQALARNEWDQEAYEGIFRKPPLPYRRLGTTCAFLLHRDVADSVLFSVHRQREWIDGRGVRLSKSYHHAQAAFALSLAQVGVGEDRTWWLEPEQLSFEGEPHGIIHHEAHKKYRFPFQERDDG